MSFCFVVWDYPSAHLLLCSVVTLVASRFIVFFGMLVQISDRASQQTHIVAQTTYSGITGTTERAAHTAGVVIVIDV